MINYKGIHIRDEVCREKVIPNSYSFYAIFPLILEAYLNFVH